MYLMPVLVQGATLAPLLIRNETGSVIAVFEGGIEFEAVSNN